MTHKHFQEASIVNLRHVTNAKAWGQKFKARLIEPGIISYADVKSGVGVVRKEVIDRCANSFVGRPLIIDHEHVTPETMEKKADGYISNVFYNEKDGWHWCEGVVHTDKGKEAIKRFGKVSCAYECNTAPNRLKNTYHCIPYDFEVTNFTGEHVAIVTNPRYEEASIMLNSKSKPMNIFKLFKKKPAVEQAAPAVDEGVKQEKVEETKAVENSVVSESVEAKVDADAGEDLAGDTTVEVDGNKIEFAALANAWSEKDKKIENSTPVEPEAVELDGETEIQVGDEKVMLNALLENYREVQRKAAEAKQASERIRSIKVKNFQKVMNASANATKAVETPKTVGSEEESIALGKKYC